MAGSQDRRFPRAEMKKQLLHQWGLTDTLSAAVLFAFVSDRSNRQQNNE